MAKTTKAETPAAADATAKTSATKTTDKSYQSLGQLAEIVVKVGPRQRMKNNKVVTVEEARNVIMTKAGYEAMDRNDEGETTHILTEAIGIPTYVTVDAPDTPEGKRRDFEVLYFRDGQGRNVPKPATAASDDEEPDED